LGTEHIESALEEFILEKTEGIPFFIEEFIKSLRDLQVIANVHPKKKHSWKP
jgi:predicted ATPase